MTGARGYPFSALVGQAELKLALLLNAVNPRLGGVLIRGEKGTAKSTAARGLAELLPPLLVVDGCRFGCDPAPGAPRCPECRAREAASGAPLPGRVRPPFLVDLPLGATEDRVLGTLDLERALKEGERHFEPGLLAKAHRGILYVDEVNLLPDHVVDALLDAAAMGTSTVEREGVSFSHPAAFVLVGTMNPEEGDLRPQLLDRFALTVDVTGLTDASERAEVVRRRIAYEADPAQFASRWEEAETAERQRIDAARGLLPRVVVADHLLDLIASICTSSGVDGLRGDIVIYKTAVTLAAYDGRTDVTSADVRRAAELALPHRLRRQPFDQPGLDREKLAETVAEHDQRLRPDDQQGNDGRDGDDAHPGDDREDEGGRPPSGGTGGQANLPADAEQVFEIAGLPRSLLEPPAPPARGSSPSPRLPAAGMKAPGRVRQPARIEKPRGRHVRSTASADHPAFARSLDIVGTLRASAESGHWAPWPKREVRPSDRRFKVREAPVGTCTLVVVDASGSMAARRRMAAAKGAVEALLLSAYQRRDEVGLITCRQQQAMLILPPTSSASLAHARLRDLPTGGRTPLASALHLARATFGGRRQRGGSGVVPFLVVVSDGRANVAMGGGDPVEEALREAHALRADGVHAMVVDTEGGTTRLGLANRLADALGAASISLEDLGGDGKEGRTLATMVRGMQDR